MNTQPEALLEIINTLNGTKPNLNPTEIYNEGWMTRLLVYQSVKEKLQFQGINFGELSNWTSEALISSPFINAKNIREGYTHADMVLGDFNVNYEKGGKITIPTDANTFGIIEAKMRSPLSQGTFHAPTYNQASRNVACIAANAPESCATFFYVVAPKSQILKRNKSGFCTKDIVDLKVIEKQIAERLELHNTSNDILNNESEIKSRASKCTIGVITYEEWLNELNSEELNDFYAKCKKWNKVE